jgi:hypothetical protein
MNLIKAWQRKRVDQKRLIMVSVAFVIIGILLGWGVGKLIGSQSGVQKTDLAQEKESIQLLSSLELVDSERFILRPNEFGEPFLLNGDVVYLKSTKNLTVEKIIASPTLVEASGSKKMINDLFRSFLPVEKINDAYFNKQRGAFVWIKKRGSVFYLIYSKNIKNYPGDLK